MGERRTGAGKNAPPPRGKSAAARSLLIAAGAVIALFAAAVYLNEAFWHVSWIPGWRRIYEAAGLSSPAYGELSGDEIAVHFIDVGQGDCSLISAGGKAVLIDGGEYSALPDVTGYLKSLGIRELDIVIATHPHSDHIGSLSGVLDEFGAERLIIPRLPDDMVPVTSSYRKLLSSADDCGAGVEYARAGAVYTLSEGCTLEILAPVSDYEDLNDYSIAARLVYGETAFLFTGDISKDAERDILESGAKLKADVIKVAHHGSGTSSLKVFLQAAEPQYAVISVGSPNDYGHPHKTTLEVLERLGISVYRTDRDGDTVFISDGKTLKVHTEKEKDAA